MIHDVEVNPVGYQHVLYATIVLYIIALIVCLVLVRPTDKALAAKQEKKQKAEEKKAAAEEKTEE